MIIKREFVVPVDVDEAVTRIADFMVQSGYQRAGWVPLQWTRGTIFGSLTAFSPLKAHTTAQISVQPLTPERSLVSVYLRVNTMGQWLLAKERAVFDAELACLAQSVMTGQVRRQVVMQAEKDARKNTFLAVLVFLAVALPVGIGVALLEIAVTGQSVYLFVGIAVGILAAFLVLQRYFGAS